jgi:uncharacterized protein (DUF302 family)
MRRLSILVVAIGLLIACGSSTSDSKTGPATKDDKLRKTYVVKDTFDNVKQLVVEALKDKGLKINTTSHISNMLQRTGKDLGLKTTIFTKAENIEFCSAIVSRNMMQADPHNIIFCPYIISVYSLAKDPKTTYVSYRRPPVLADKKSNAVLREVEKLLDEIARATTEGI